MATVQNRYNLLDRASDDVLRYCTEQGIGFIPWFPIASGRLAEPGGPVAEIAERLGATAPAGGAGVAAAAVVGDAADPGHVDRWRTWRRTCRAATLRLEPEPVEKLDAAA